MVSWFPTVTEEEILAVYTAAVLSNTNNIYKYGFIIFSREVCYRRKPTQNDFFTHLNLQQLRQSHCVEE